MTTKTARSLGRYMAAWLAEAAIGGAIALAIANAETNLFILSGTDPTSTPPGNVSRHRAGRPGGRVRHRRCDAGPGRHDHRPLRRGEPVFRSTATRAETVEVAVYPLAKEHEPDRRGCWQKRPDGMPYEEG